MTKTQIQFSDGLYERMTRHDPSASLPPPEPPPTLDSGQAGRRGFKRRIPSSLWLPARTNLRSWTAIVGMAAALLASKASYAASIVTTNFRALETNLITDSSNALIPNDTGIVAIGVFDATDAQLRTWAANYQITAIADSFVQFSHSISMGFSTTGGIYYSIMNGSIAGGDAFAGNHIYTFIGNGQTFAASSEILVFKHNHAFMPDPLPTSDVVLMLEGDAGRTVVGIAGANSASVGPIMDQLTFQTVPGIPEPSSMAAVLLASALGSLFLRRRRSLGPLPEFEVLPLAGQTASSVSNQMKPPWRPIEPSYS